MKKYILSLDQGTTSSRCILFDKGGNICSMAQKEFTQIYPQPGWVEHNPREIWSSQLAVATEAMAMVGAGAEDIAGIGITNQRETTICWDKTTGEPVYNAIVWQCRRTSEMIEQLKTEGYEDLIRERTGLVPDAYFSATKIAWILEHVPGARERAQRGEILFGTVDTWLIWNLTKGRVHATDYTNASRTMLFDIHRLCWDGQILERLGIPACMLPKVYPSSHIFGLTASSLLGGEIPIAGAAGDQQAALFGQTCFQPGQAKNTYGTGCFLLMNTGHEACTSKHGLITTIAASAPQMAGVDYALEGSVFMAGALMQWLRDEMGLLADVADSDALARSVPDTEGVYVVPAFTGLGAPWWDAEARGAIYGLTRGLGRAHIVRAALESLAYQVCDLVEAMEEDAGVQLRALKVDGGASRNDFLMQFQADMLGRPVERPCNAEATALGAAYLAGLTSGFWPDLTAIAALPASEEAFAPAGAAGPDRAALIAGWREAVARTRT